MEVKIYAIRGPSGLPYIGSTTKTLNVRLSRHKTQYKTFLDGKYNDISVFHLFEEHGADNCSIELLYSVLLPDNDAVRFRLEQYYIDKIPNINTNRAYRSPEQLVEQKCAQRQKPEHKAKLLEYNRQKIPCPHCTKDLSRGNMATHINSKHPK